MDAFRVHRQLIDDYRSFTEGFVDIRDIADQLRILNFIGNLISLDATINQRRGATSWMTYEGWRSLARDGVTADTMAPRVQQLRLE